MRRAYVLVTGLSLPGAAVMNPGRRRIFGLAQGTVLVFVRLPRWRPASPFCWPAPLLRDLDAAQLHAQLAPIEAGVLRRDGVLLPAQPAAGAGFSVAF